MKNIYEKSSTIYSDYPIRYKYIFLII